MMKPCGYRGISDGVMVECRNHEDLIHGGFVPLTTCDDCQYSIAPDVARDFFSQTARLLVAKHRSGELQANPRPCGGCGETKHRVPETEQAGFQFVWVYWHGGAAGDEIRWSVRSVEKFFQGAAKITIVGDRPPWFTGHMIPKPRIRQVPSHGFRDSLSKLHRIVLSPEIDEKFCWMMDDVYFVAPVSIEDLEVPRAEPFHRSKRNTWQRLKAATMDVLAAAGRTQHDYATHLPHVVEKQKLKHLIGEFDLTRRTLIWEVLYGNLYRGGPIRSRPFLCRIQNQIRYDQYRYVIGQSSVVNHNSGAWCQALWRYLAELLPDPSPTELSGDPQPKFVLRKKVSKVVKRRPAHTHRSFIEKRSVDRQEETPVAENRDIPYVMIIQSAYTDPRLSRQRLDVSRHTAIPSLAFQEERPVVHIVVNPEDPLLEERLEEFRSTGCEVKPLYRTEWRLYREDWELPDGRKIVSRLDDDDVIAKDFCRRNRIMAPRDGEHVLLWPVGYVFWRQQIFRLDHRGIQFVTLVTDKMCDPHQEQHWEYHRRWKSVVVSTEPGWIWVRHGAAATSTLKRYRTKQLGRIDSTRIPINLRAIVRAIEPCGLASGTYAEKADQSALQHVLLQNILNAPRPKGRFAVAITTYSEHDTQQDRDDVKRTIDSCRRTTDISFHDARIHIFDDGSCESYKEFLNSIGADMVHSADQNRGIAAAKNRCLELFDQNPELEVVFMIDDDIEFLKSGWMDLYLAAMQDVPLLSFNDPAISGHEGFPFGARVVESQHTCGVLVAVSRSCWEQVDRYAELPERYGAEHTEYYMRAAIAGVVPRDGYYDAAGSEAFIRIASNDGGPGTPKERQVELNMESDQYRATEQQYRELRQEVVR